jgi:mRNA interferase RelE/StbE
VTYKVKYEKEAYKFLQSNKIFGKKFFDAFENIAKDINTNFLKYDIKKLKSVDEIYRLRIGKYRAIFKVIDEKILILILDIASSGDIYKNI